MVRVFPMAWETWVLSQVESYQRQKKKKKRKKKVLDTSLLNTHHYQVWIKGQVEQSREGVVAIKRGALGSPSTTVTNLLMVSRKQRNHNEDLLLSG